MQKAGSYIADTLTKCTENIFKYENVFLIKCCLEKSLGVQSYKPNESFKPIKVASCLCNRVVHAQSCSLT